MATGTVLSNSSPAQVTPAQARSTAWMLVFGGVMLLVMAAWLRAKHEDLTIVLPLLVALLGLASLGLAAWQFLTIIKQNITDEQRSERLTQQRRATTIAVMLGGAALMLLGVYLGVTYKLAAFAEAVGLCLYALMALVAGRLLARPPGDTGPSKTLDTIRQNYGAVSLMLVILGVVAALVAIGIILLQRPGWAYAPELGGLLALGLVFLAFGMRLFLSTPQDLTLDYVRHVVLGLGGGLGVVLTIATIWRAIALFLVGADAWQGENSWRLWLCAYVGLIGLSLMFGSLLLGKTEVHTSAPIRRTLYGYTTILNGLLVLGILIVVNVVFYWMFPYSFDWTRTRGLHALSPSTKNLLSGLTTRTHFYVLLPSEDFLMKDVRHLMDNIQAHSSNADVKYLSPDRDFLEFEQLAQYFEEIVPRGKDLLRGDKSGRGILVVYGDLPSDPKDKSKLPPYEFIPKRALYQEEFNRNADNVQNVYIFKGEGELVKKLDYLVKGKSERKIYILQGQGELDVTRPHPDRPTYLTVENQGAGILMDRLRKDNYKVQGLSFKEQPPNVKGDEVLYVKEGKDKRKNVPEDAFAVMILGPSELFDQATLDALERYMDAGGRLFVAFDVTVDRDFKAVKTTGLEDFLKKYGVKVAAEFGMRFPQPGKADDPRKVIAMAPEETENPVARHFYELILPLDTPRIIRPDATGKYKSEVLLQLEPKFFHWAETNLRAINNPLGLLREYQQQGALQRLFSKEPLPVAVAVAEDGVKPRLVVFGDAEFVSNNTLSMRGSEELYSLAVSSLEWMGERKGRIGPQPKEVSTYAFGKGVETTRMVLLPGWLMTLAILGLGAGVWLVRRK